MSDASPLKKPAKPGKESAKPTRRLLGVIDVGARAIRLEIAETGPGDKLRILDTLTHPVALGKDTFGEGQISRETIEQCVRILQSYRTVLGEYGLTTDSSVRAVATSAVREAGNRDFFLDRIFMATGFTLVCLDEVELNRLTYLAVRDLLMRQRIRAPSRLLVLDVGGGTTEALFLENSRVTFSETYRMGALRSRERFETLDAPEHRLRSVLTQDIEHTIERMRHALPCQTIPYMIAMSTDARLAAARLEPAWEELEVARFPFSVFSEYCERIARLSLDEVVRACGITYAEAETFGTALLTIREIARAFGVRHLLVPKASLRTALEIDLAGRPSWTAHLREQIEQAACTLGEKFHFDLRHARYVAGLCDRLFEELQTEHGLNASYGFLLRIAALLHEIGLFISNRNHHKHSLYLILNSDLFGLSRNEIQLIALIARYHRRSPPSALQPDLRDLPRDRRLVLFKLSAILRVADALARSNPKPVSSLQFERKPGRLKITFRGADDLSLERLALQEKGGWFEDVYGMAVELRSGPLLKESESNV